MSLPEKNIADVKGLVKLMIDQFLKEKNIQGELDGDSVGEVLKLLGKEKSGLLKVLYKEFADRERYPDMPIVRIAHEEIEKYPDIYMVGWRKDDKNFNYGAERNGPHYHPEKESVLYVVDGSIQETLYLPNEPMTNENGFSFFEATREYAAESGSVYAQPIIHSIEVIGPNDVAVALHAYIGKKESISVFEKIKATTLRRLP